jgi:DNA helicase-2/ATP-dependent DNA helicase PcrA
MDKLEVIANQNNISLWDVLTNPALPNSGFHSGTLKKLNSFSRLIGGFMSQLSNMSAFDLSSEIATQSGILKELHQDKSHESQTRLENLEELFNAIREFSDNRQESGEDNSLIDFLEEVSLLTDQDTDNPEDMDKITLMTIHAAKGLEFKNVYIAGVEEGLFPSAMAGTTEAGLEEERRLFYVALTRAEEHATLTCSRSRYKYGELNFARPSRFLSEIDQEYLNIPEEHKSFAPPKAGGSVGQPQKKKYNFNLSEKPERNNKPAFSRQSPDKKETSARFNNQNLGQSNQVKPGMMVEHDRFGEGKVLHIEGHPPDEKATVFFKNAGQKQLLLKFAKLKIIT